MKINPNLKEDLRKYLFDKIKKDKSTVTVISSYVLKEEEKKLLQSKLTSFDWSMVKYVVDPKVIAGVIIKVGSKVIDLSLNASLQSLQHTIYESY